MDGADQPLRFLALKAGQLLDTFKGPSGGRSKIPPSMLHISGFDSRVCTEEGTRSREMAGRAVKLRAVSRNAGASANPRANIEVIQKSGVPRGGKKVRYAGARAGALIPSEPFTS